MSYTASYIVNSSSAQGTTDFTFTFPYIKEEHIEVFLNYSKITQGSGSNQYQVITNVSPKLIRLNTGIASANLRVEVRRNSSLGTPLVDYADGSTLTANDLDTSALQSLYIDQELRDNQTKTVSVDEDTGLPSLGESGANLRLTNVADPVGAQDAVTKAYLERTGSITSTQILDGTITSTDIANGTIVNDDINTSAAIAGTKINPNFGSQNISATGTLNVSGNVTLGDNVNSDTLHVNAKVSNHLIPASGVGLGTSNDKWSSAYVTNAYLDSVDINGGSIDGAAIGANSLSTAAFSTVTISGLTVSGQANLNGGVDLGSGTEDRITINGYIDSHVLPNTTDFDLGSSSKKWGEVHTVSLLADGITVSGTATIASLAGGALVDSSEHNAATVNDTSVFSTAASDARYFIQTASTDEVIKSGYLSWPVDATKDNYVATPGAIDQRIQQIVDDVGGFVVAANEGSFPASHPDPKGDAGTIVSITALSAERTANGSGVLTTGFSTTGSPGQQVTINNCGNNQVFAAGYGLLVQTTSTLHTYDFVRYVPNTSQVATVAANTTNINTVAGIASDVTAVAADATDIGAVAGKATEIGRLGTADAVGDLAILGTIAAAGNLSVLGTSEVVADMALLGTSDVVADMALLGDSTVIADMALLGDSAVIADMAIIADTSNLITNIGTVAGIQANVTTVAGIASNVTTVAGDTTAINNITTNLAAVQGAATNATNAASSATAAASSATSAATSATTATTQASTATTQATNAASSATSSASSATTATTQASTATTQATNSAASASTANTYQDLARQYRDAASAILTQTKSIAYNLVDSVSSHTNWGNITDGDTADFADESSNTFLTMAEGSATYNYGGIT